jgi:hypothetical protein
MIFILCLFMAGSLNAAGLEGMVSDQAGTAVSGAYVSLYGSDATGDSILLDTMSGFEGEFSLVDVKSGTYCLSCTHAGYLPFRSAPLILEENTTLFVNVTLLTLNATCINSISGHVYSVPPLLPALIPLAGADVFLAGRVRSYHTRSNADGLYEFKNIQTGTYYLSAEAFRHIPQYNIDTLEILNGTDISAENIYLLPLDPAEMVKLSGHVWEESFTDQDFPQPVHPAYITLLPGRIDVLKNESGGTFVPDTVYPLIRVVNNPDGSYEIPDIPKGYYNVRCEARGYQSAYIFLLDLSSGDVEQDFVLKPYPVDTSATLTGHVWEDCLYIQQPVYPAKIVLSTCKRNGDSLFYWTENNPDGSYQIGNIVPGKYTVKCMARGYYTQVIHELEITAAEIYQDFYLVPLVNPPDGWISGKVHFDENNLPVASAYISFYSIDGSGLPVVPADSNYYSCRPGPFGVYTDSTGRYTALLPPGKYYVACKYDYGLDCFTADCIGYPVYHEFYDDVHRLAEATAVAVLPGQITPDINFGIPWMPGEPTVTVTGRVTDDQNTPLERALVRVWQIDVPVMVANSNCRVYSGYTDERGNYKIHFRLQQFVNDQVFTPFPVNGFIVSAEKSGYLTEFYQEKSEPYLADKLFAFGDTVFSHIDFTLAPQAGGNAISGVITSDAGEALSDVFVIGARISSGEIVFTFSDNLGRYTLGNLKEDYYVLLFAARRYVPEFYDNVYCWKEATPVLAAGQVTGIDASLTPLCRQFNWGMLTGLIRTENGQPLNGAMVMIKNQAGEVLNYALSDGGGNYQIQGLPDGINQICVSKVNYSTTTTWFHFNVNDYDVLLMNFTLPLDPAPLALPGNDQASASLPSRIELMGNYPNPFNPETHIRFGLPAAQQVNLKIYDLLGRQVTQLLDAYLAAGIHTVKWNGTDHLGRSVSSGIYFYALQGDGFRLVKKMLLNR